MQFFQNVTMWLETFKHACHDEFICVQNFAQMQKMYIKREYSIAYSVYF